MNTMRKHYRIKSRVRFTFFIVIVIVILACVTNLISGDNEITAMEKETYTTVEVVSGDTLWAIADEYMLDDMDPRKSVHILCTTNNTSADAIYPGQLLKIPDKYVKKE